MFGSDMQTWSIQFEIPAVIFTIELSINLLHKHQLKIMYRALYMFNSISQQLNINIT
jgi:hypothetical protein